LLFATPSDLEELDKVVGGAIEHARNSLTGFFGTSQDSYNPSKLQDLSDDYKIFENIQPFYKGKSGSRYYIFIQPRGTASNTGFTQHFVQSIQHQVDQFLETKQFPNLKIQFSGGMITRIEENQVIQNDLKNSVIVAVVLVTFILALYNRSILSIILLFIPLVTSLSLTFAFTRLLIGHVNIISGFLVAILTGLGINYGIHLYIRFKQELRKGQTIPAAAELVATQVGRSGVVAMATTISVFSLLIFSDFRGFSEFGAIAAIGIMCSFFSYFFLLPALVLCADKIHGLRKPRPRLFSLRISAIYSSTPVFLVSMFILLLIFSLFLLPDVQFEYDFRKLRGESPAVHHSLDLFSLKQYESKKTILKRIHDKLIKDRDIIEISMGTRRYRKLKRLVEAKPFDEKHIPANLLKRFMAGDQYLLLIFSPADKNFFDVRNIYQLEKEIKELKTSLAKDNIHFAVLNENLLAAAILDLVQLKGPQTLAWAMGLVFLILLWDYRSPRLAFKTFLPLFTGLALTGALMAVFHIKLNFINMVMLPSIVGIMVDHCVYLGHHILDYSRHETTKSVKETGSAIILSALTSLAGYASLNIAHHAGVRSISHVVEVGIIVCTLCALFMLPVLFQMGAHKSPSYRAPKQDPQN
jgi:predicted RND superfamily exporter protein